MNRSDMELDSLLRAEGEDQEGLRNAWDAVKGISPGPRMNPVRAKAIGATLRQHARQRPMRRAVWAVAASFAALLIVGGLWLTRPLLHQVPPGAAARAVSLADGSTVELAPGSMLRESRRSLSKRTVDLVGEAWFQVVHDADRPFVVLTREASVSVIGTRFSVRAWPDTHGTQVYLESGTVQVSPLADGGLPASMSPGESIEVASGGVSPAPRYGAAVANAWLNQDLVFRAEPVDAVLRQVERHFGITVDRGDSLDPTRTVSGVFRTPVEAEPVIRDLATYLGVQYHATTTGFRLVDR